MKQSSGILTDVFERVTDAFVALDTNWCYTYMNKKAGEIFLRSPADMIGKHIWTEFPEGIDQIFYKAYHRAMAEQQYIHVEEYYPPYDKWFENHIYPSPDGLSIFFRDITQRKNAEQLNEKIQKENDVLINSTRDLLWSVSNDYTLITANGPFVKGLKDNGGFIIKPGDNILSSQHFPEDYLQYWKGIYQKGLSGESVMTEAFTPQTQSSDLLWFELSIEPIFNENKIIGIACSMRNITERKKMDLILAGEKKVMEMIATEKQLEEILHTVALNYESYSDHAFCSIQLLNEAGTHIRHGAGPSLPDAYNKGIDGEPIGPVAGSCGTAAYLKERVIVSDIATDPLWVKYRDFALSFGLKAAWSTPIINTEGKVYGTFAIYYKECRTPEETELVLIDRSANQVKIVLERYYKDTQIKESEEKYRTLVEQASDAIFITDPTGQFITVNTSASKLSQHSEKELLQMSIHDFAVMDDIQKNPFHFDELKEGKTVFTERVMKGKNGVLLNVDITAKLLSDGRLLVFVRDITKRKKTEEDLKKFNERFEMIARTTNDALWEWNLETGELWANQTHQHLYGLTTADSVPAEGQWEQKIHPDDRERIIAAQQQALASDKNVWISEYRFETKNGFIDIYDRTYIVCNAAGKPIRLTGSMMDITERKKAEEKIRQLNQGLELRVRERTAELEKTNAELEEINDLFVGREARIIELKEELEALKTKLK